MAHPTKILVVDDRPENLFALDELLARPDRQVFAAASGKDALRLALEHDFALVLLDVEMPGMDGFETAQILRSAERTRLLPIIFVTAADRTDERSYRGYEAGAIDFLFKPINSHMLRSKVELFVQLSRKSHELERTAAALQDKVSDLEYVNQTLSHDLRGPLRSIRSFSQVIAESGSQLDDEAKDALDRVIKASAHLGSMIEDLYNLLQLSADPSEPATLDLGVVLRDVIEAVRRDVEATGARIEHDPLPRLAVNRRLVVQVLQNLIANAIRFRGEATPAIHISAHRLRNAWQISIRDNGIGIPAAERERVFKLFARLDGTRSGSGVGLALCKRAVEKLGGRIWIEPASREGTIVSFTIPDDPPD